MRSMSKMPKKIKRKRATTEQQIDEMINARVLMIPPWFISLSTYKLIKNLMLVIMYTCVYGSCACACAGRLHIWSQQFQLDASGTNEHTSLVHLAYDSGGNFEIIFRNSFNRIALYQ